MEEFASRDGDGLVWKKGHERVWIVPWGTNGVRVRVTQQAEFLDLPQALLDAPPTGEVKIEIGEKLCTLVNGEMTVELSPRGNVTFIRTSDKTVLLKECVKNTSEYLGRTFIPSKGVWQIEQRFYSNDNEKFYGLGQHQNGYLDQKGCVIDLLHRNMEVAIPFLVSNLGYGFLWNHPGTGRVELGKNETRWVASAARQIDYYVVAEQSIPDIVHRYARATGFPTRFPRWASGFWQCKLRYKSQDELMAVAREHKKRGLPISVIIADFFHWTQMGDWKFDPELWPDPEAMVAELKDMGIELMVSVWPTVNLTSENYEHMNAHGMLVRNERGNPVQNTADDNKGSRLQTFYDAMNPEARAFLWEKIREGYYKLGVKHFWLDTCEPELSPVQQDNTRYYLGNGDEVACLYPLLHQKGFYDGLISEGETEPLTMSRSAWAGSQRFGSVIWSADIPSTFDSLRRQITGGMNIGLSGIPWWNTDIGGFYGGEIADPEFHELLIRWFQYGVFCPVCRLHGVRRMADKKEGEWAPNEVWSYGDEVYNILSEQLKLRERLRPYIMTQMRSAEETGHPVIRPLFFDFPDDPKTWDIEDQYLFGPDILVAPILELGARSRTVYLPAGTTWRNAWTGQTHQGGQELEADAPIERIPVYFRAESGPLEDGK
ncbi:MAG: glycoside hydrolase family 31 protein [Phycisphaerae bacterium]|nr:glycoside hydrolase family 31 protein [Phycisphaerae bacterium]